MTRLVGGRYAEIANTRRVGGQSEVFQAADLQQGGRHVAVKVMPAKSDDIYRIYFERETAALRKLDHPNIASLLDCGSDEGLAVYYVVLDWVPQTIQAWLADLADPPGWDDVAEVIALPLASALAHSHSLSVVHRDIKPGNVLWDGGRPLLADFALSKIKSQIAGASDATVVGMTSAPWAPPDMASRGSARFDVYGLAATLLQCITDWQMRDYPDIAKALTDADVPPDVMDLLKRALDPDPAKRPSDGQVFFVELQAIQTARSRHWHSQKLIPFELSASARTSLGEAAGGRTAEAVIDERMGSSSCVVPRLKATPDGRSSLTSQEFRLVGDQIELILKFKSEYQLVCLRAEVLDFEELERWRHDQDAVTLDRRDFAWTARRPPNPQQSARAVVEVHALLEKAVQDSGDRFSDRYRQARLNGWSQLIDAKEQLEKRLEEPIPYTQLGGSRGEYELEASGPLTGALLDQERLARPSDGPTERGTPVTVIDVGSSRITVKATGPRMDLPTSGVLVRDRTPSQTAIRRQKNALSSLREGSAARPHLRELVLDPTQARPPEIVSFEALTPDLDDDKKSAVAKALGAPDLFLVSGPPGTGKTAFICELVNQYLARRPGDKVLLVSQMHVAIDNAVTRLYRSGVSSVVRLASRDDSVDPDAAHLLLSNKLAAWATAVGDRAREGMAAIAQRQGARIEHLSLALLLEEAQASLRQSNQWAESLGPLDDEDRLDNEDLPEERAGLLVDYLRATERADAAVGRVKALADELGIELSQAPDAGELAQVLETLVGGSATDLRLRELLRSQGDWLASLGDPRSAEPIFLPTQSVVAGTCMGFLANSHIQDMQFDLCIIDEASRATAAELLVPMTRSKRWVMVGDTQQLPPMLDEVFEHRDLVEGYDLDKLFLSSSLFATLLGEIPEGCTTDLVTQHRMAVPIGELISEAFYGGALSHDPSAVLDPISVMDDDRLVWFSTSRRGNRHEEARHASTVSSSNKLEAETVSELVGRIDTAAARGGFARLDGSKLEVLVLSGYRGQCTEIERALRRLTLDHVSTQIKTIDAVQGREADVVIFSVTRSNTSGELGFLSESYQGRINVALSRAREVLWVVGDSDFCASQEGPLQRVLTHILDPEKAGRVEYL